MALALQPTLVELRQAVLSRCGLATEGNIPRAIQGVIDERIRSAQLQLYELFPWLVTYVQRDIELQSQVSDYDVPDDTEPGKITFVAVRRKQDGWIFVLDRGIRPDEMNYVNQQTIPIKGAMPLRFDFIDTIIRVAPIPDVDYYDYLQLAYYQTPGRLLEDSERCVVDGEALKMLSEILVKQHFGGQDTTKLEAQLAQYVDRVKMKQSNGEGFQMGGHQSLVGRTQRRNRFAWSAIRGNTWRDWRPW
jgi:hypothetical protein